MPASLARVVRRTAPGSYQGQFDASWTATLPGIGTTMVTHNLDVQPARRVVIAECTTADAGYAVGD
ncbi:hypothetical protein MKK75_30590 [Methylobacterium sp. J-030]|uniref:hypothetical protein n=1 Tax=Methylobacterium sp. J-030 TaxID=2836627 RepID=UPI001FBA3C0D|nr:hypothetical protein [Methylobacterium sp. J-030]MCJ2073088.1 hypothetical protein [Methylobacterium sp. J-030]